MLDSASRDFNFAGLSERDPQTRNKNLRVPVVVHISIHSSVVNRTECSGSVTSGSLSISWCVSLFGELLIIIVRCQMHEQCDPQV